MKRKRYLFAILAVVFVFFSYSVTYTYDTFHYLNYVDILFGRVPFNTWDIVRGPSFPVTIFLFNLIFGENQNAHLILQFTNFMVLLVLLNKTLNIVIDKPKHKNIINGLLVLFMAFNPIIFGYYHVLLTEFIAITLTILSIYMSFKWIYIENKKDKILYTALFSLIITYLWFIKQPYALCVFAPVMVAGIISFFKNKTLKNFAYRCCSLGIMLVVMVIGIVSWNTILIKNNVNMNTGRDSSTMLSGIMLQLKSYKLVDKNTESFDGYNLSEQEIKDISEDKVAILLTLNSNKEVVDKDVFTKENGSIKTSQVILVSIQNVFQNPSIVLNDYAHNYCALTSICLIGSDDTINYYVADGFDFKDLYENKTIGYRIFYNHIDQNTFWVPERFQANSTKYTVYKNVGIINKAFIALMPVTTFLYKFILIINPILLIISIVLYIIIGLKHKEFIKMAELNMICISLSFMYLVANAYLNAIIDRYSVESFIPSIISTIIIVVMITNLMLTRNKKEEKKAITKKSDSKTPKKESTKKGNKKKDK